jgi:hypothetical protein
MHPFELPHSAILSSVKSDFGWMAPSSRKDNGMERQNRPLCNHIQFSDITRIQVLCKEALRRGVGVGSRRGDDAHIEEQLLSRPGF